MFPLPVPVAMAEGFASADARSPRSRQFLRLKGLPDARFVKLWAGHGSLARCEGCGQVIGSDEMEFELQFRQGAETATIKLHRECWEPWRDEC